jgi:PBSX family phage terminase large subunit
VAHSSDIAERMSAVLRPRMDIPDKLLPILQPRRFKIVYGGRGSAKSHTVAQVLLMLGTQRRLRILCVREVQKTLADSSMQVLRDYIERLGLGGHYQVFKNEIRGWNGTTFAFTGLKDHTADSLKSYEGVDIVWIEEAHSVSERSWNILIPTMRKETEGPFGAGSEIWATFNPDQSTDYVYKRFVKDGDADALVLRMNWRDNPWFGQIMNTERLKLKALNEDLYQHIWEGKLSHIAGLLFKRRWFKFYDTLPANLSLYMASDYAGAPDPDSDREPDYTEHGVAG